MPVSRPVAVRFWEKVDRRGPDECWEWQGSRMPYGYGRFAPVRTAVTTAHRVAYELCVGPIPGEGRWVVGHHCDNPPCVNPRHLFLGSDGDNHADAREKGRSVPPPRLMGTSHPKTRLTPDQVYEIRRRRDAGESGLAIAADFDIGLEGVYAIGVRRNWRHLPEETTA